ncbi:MAG: hypothetical protein EA001_13585 [Oscillatoriales cyanobacterium]|nr:MAG: hypothetical protein EA001_13585 [Oscillatoriales cyanobacterium]
MIPIALALALSLKWAIAPVAIAGLPPNPLAQATPTPTPPAGIRSDRLGLNSLRLGDTPQRVRARLGRPQRTRNQPPGNYGRYESWDYPNLTLGFGDGALAMMSTTRPNWGTAAGVRVGDRISRITAAYGEPDWRDTNRWGYVTIDGAFLTFVLRGDRIVEILCGWLPD